MLFAGATSGCVAVYQPMSGLHRPVVVDPQLANFQDVNLAIYCVPGAALARHEAAEICQKLGVLFENQGALVTTHTRDRRVQLQDDAEGGAAKDPTRTDLALEYRSRELNSIRNPVSWMLCIGTLTLVPGLSESTFTADIVVRDGTGFLLASESLQGRLVHRFGVGAWAGNKLLDRVWRDQDEALSGDAAARDLSRDLYRQVSQILFNAKLLWQVQQEAVPAGPEG